MWGEEAVHLNIHSAEAGTTFLHSSIVASPMSTEYDSGDEKQVQVASTPLSSPTPSTIRSIVIIATSTMAMIVNVSPRSNFPCLSV